MLQKVTIVTMEETKRTTDNAVTTDSHQKKIAMNDQTGQNSVKDKPINSRELDILDFLMREKYLRMGFAGTVNEILAGINDNAMKAMKNEGLGEEECKKNIVSKHWLYKLLKRLSNAGFIDEGVLFENKKTYFITTEGINHYAKCLESTQDEVTRVAEALEPFRHNWAGKLDTIIDNVFPQE